MFMGQSVTGENFTVDVSSGSKCHSGRNMGGRNVKASTRTRTHGQGRIDMDTWTCTYGHEHMDMDTWVDTWT
jgi:hypothetical protein